MAFIFGVDMSKKIKPRKTMGWDEYFMFMCAMVAQKSKDPNTAVGSILVDDENCVLGTGYNGMPKGCNDEVLPWNRDGEWNKYLFISHAESNCLLFSNPLKIKGSRMYCLLFPCNDCAKKIIQAGVKEVIYFSDKYAKTMSVKASKKMFKMAGIKVRRFVPKKKSLILSLEKV